MSNFNASRKYGRMKNGRNDTWVVNVWHKSKKRCLTICECLTTDQAKCVTLLKKINIHPHALPLFS